jgi:glycosidase
MMNTSSTHDAPRLLTCFYNPNKYKYGSTPNDDKNYKTGKPDAETYRRVSLYLMHLFTTVGSPQIWNGEEMGMWGADDPDCRKPLWWQGLQFAPETRNNVQPGPSAFDPVGFDPAVFALYQKLIAIRKSEPALQTGAFEFVVAEGGKLAYKRTNGENEILVCFNMGDKEAFFELPLTFKYRNLLDNKSLNESKIKLGPLSAAILQRQPVK